MTSGEVGTLIYTPATSFQVSGIPQDFRGANNYRPNAVGDPYGDTQFSDELPQSGHRPVIPTDPSQPFGNAPRNSVLAPWFWQLDLVAAKEFRLPFGDHTRAQIPIRGVQSPQPHQLPRPERQPQRGHVRHDHGRPTMRVSCSSASR